jgi:hypothetical protein
MKTCALYGFIIALADSLLILALFFLGFHSDPDKLQAAKMIGGLGALAIGITFTVLGIKARRSEVPETEEFGYGRALGAGVLISLVASVLMAVFNYVYGAFINPGFFDIIIQDQLDKMQAKGITGSRADQAERILRFIMSPGVYSIYTLVAGFIFAFVLSLIIAAFLKRPEPATPPTQQ